MRINWLNEYGQVEDSTIVEGRAEKEVPIKWLINRIKEKIKIFTDKQKIKKSRKIYEKQVNKEARKQNKFLENILKKWINKNDIILMDAFLEKGFLTDYDQKHNLQKSTLTVKSYKSSFRSELVGGWGLRFEDFMEGIIEDKNIKIKRFHQDGMAHSIYSGTIDRHKISPQFAEEIFLKYKDIWKIREERIYNTYKYIHNEESNRKKEKRQKKLREELLKEERVVKKEELKNKNKYKNDKEMFNKI